MRGDEYVTIIDSDAFLSADRDAAVVFELTPDGFLVDDRGDYLYTRTSTGVQPLQNARTPEGETIWSLQGGVLVYGDSTFYTLPTGQIVVAFRDSVPPFEALAISMIPDFVDLPTTSTSLSFSRTSVSVSSGNTEVATSTTLFATLSTTETITESTNAESSTFDSGSTSKRESSIISQGSGLTSTTSQMASSELSSTSGPEDTSIMEQPLSSHMTSTQRGTGLATSESLTPFSPIYSTSTFPTSIVTIASPSASRVPTIASSWAASFSSVASSVPLSSTFSVSPAFSGPSISTTRTSSSALMSIRSSYTYSAVPSLSLATSTTTVPPGLLSSSVTFSSMLSSRPSPSSLFSSSSGVATSKSSSSGGSTTTTTLRPIISQSSTSPAINASPITTTAGGAVPVSSSGTSISTSPTSSASSGLSRTPTSSVSSATTSSSLSSLPSYPSKRGLAYTNVTTLPFYPPPSPYISWSYNYYSLPNASDNVGAYPSTQFRYIPLLYNDASSLTSIWAGNVNYSISHYGTDAIFGFNEPDACFSGQSACMNLSSVLSGYQRFLQPFASIVGASGGAGQQGGGRSGGGHVKIGAPAVTNIGAPSGLDYLARFLGNATLMNLTVDFINIHWYASPYNIQYFMDHVTTAYNVTGQAKYPVWVTEFGMDRGDYDQNVVVEFVSDYSLNVFFPFSQSWSFSSSLGMLCTSITVPSTRTHLPPPHATRRKTSPIGNFYSTTRLTAFFPNGWQ
ncbi:hypothetical protein PV08_09170 [Exophiala spinifera]|uniref:Asl1-like glycosyl hydrolase catalytic domain-containing protein n=1 Tax=Exophiala spinifera TaxID=91928 RepID=A0A0D1ZFZ3_9EURO|nr:uncharacterized protein PV08_09170 [Exophiala spinifera]KIW11897.1 hypothetical protein PV08_09170 [Exophiala spinifera]